MRSENAFAEQWADTQYRARAVVGQTCSGDMYDTVPSALPALVS
jgi:hypothetical protein